MAKHKKTRQQKIMADQRRESHTAALYSFSPESLTSQVKQTIEPVKHSSSVLSTSYQYLAGDLRKTALFTTVVVLFEIVLRYFFK